MADIALGATERIIKAVLAIKKAVGTVRQNKEECQYIGRSMDRVSALLSFLQQEKDMMKNPAMRGPCDCLAHSLEEALELIEHCQKKNALQHFLTAGDIAKQLRRVREDIQGNATLAILAIATQNLHTTNNIQDLLITLTMTLTRRIDYGGGADPLLTQAQDAGVATCDASGRSEINSEIITVTTASVGSHDPSSSLTEVNLPEYKATMHQISKAGGHSVVVKQKIVIKVQMGSDSSRSKAMALTARACGVSSLGVTGDGMDQLEVVGSGLDFICLVECLRKKMGHADLLKVEEVKARDTRAVVVNTQGAQPAYYEPANNDVRRRSGIQSIITKLMKFMWPHDDDIGGTSSPPPSSPPPLHVEHMANRPPPE